MARCRYLIPPALGLRMASDLVYALSGAEAHLPAAQRSPIPPEARFTECPNEATGVYAGLIPVCEQHGGASNQVEKPEPRTCPRCGAGEVWVDARKRAHCYVCGREWKGNG